jgi:hypothetical protein
VTVDAVATYLDLDFAEGIALRQRMRAGAPLLKHGLLSVELGRTCDPQDWPTAEIKITRRAWAAMIGEAASDDVLGQPAASR